MQREHGRDSGGGVGAAPAHARLCGDAFHEREARAARERQLAREHSGCEQDEIAGASGHEPLRPGTQTATHGSLFVLHAQRETARGAPGGERVGERHRLEHGHQVVEAIRAARAHGQPQVELGARLHRDGARRRPGGSLRRPLRAGPRLRARARPGTRAAHRAWYRIHRASATNSATAAWIGRSDNSTCEGSSLVSDTRTRCR